MPKLVIINCLIISIICSLIAPSFLLVTFIPAEGETVYDVNNIDQEKLGSMSSEDAKEYINKEVPFKKVTGMERFTYLFSQPGTGIHYLKVSLWMLLPFLLATLITSYLNIKYVISREKV